MHISPIIALTRMLRESDVHSFFLYILNSKCENSKNEIYFYCIYGAIFFKASGRRGASIDYQDWHEVEKGFLPQFCEYRIKNTNITFGVPCGAI